MRHKLKSTKLGTIEDLSTYPQGICRSAFSIIGYRWDDRISSVVVELSYVTDRSKFCLCVCVVVGLQIPWREREGDFHVYLQVKKSRSGKLRKPWNFEIRQRTKAVECWPKTTSGMCDLYCDGPWRMHWQGLLSCELLAIPADSTACILIIQNVYIKEFFIPKITRIGLFMESTC